MKGTGTMLLVALLLLAGPALAATPAPLAPPPSLAANDDGATSAAKGPRIEVVIQNGDEQEQVARLRLEDQRTHAVLHDKWIRLPARDVRVLHIPAPEGSYTLNLSQSVYAAGTHNGGGSSHSFDTSGCEGDFRSRFDARGGAFGYYADVARSGCLHPPREMRALIEEARALGHGSGARGVHVALPHDADRGAYRAWGGMHDFPADAGLMRFGWRDARTVPDAAGAPREVREMLTEGPGRSYGWTTRLLASEQVELRDPKQWFHYSGDARFVAAVREAGGPVAEDRQARVTLRHDTTYDPTPRSCLFRAAYQGAEVRPGQSWSAGDVCAAMGLAQWKAGASFETDGRRVVPLYAWEDRAEATLVARLLLADGVAYPVAFDAWRMPRDEPIVRAGYRLVGLEREGAPILRAPPGAPSPPPALAPLDPLRGPALHARGAITFPLDEASDAARADPTLRELQALLARRDAALLGARLTEREEAAAQARTQEWYLVFGARGIDPVGVTCSRAVLAPGTAGPVSCTGGSLPIQWALLDPPRMGRADLPSRAASFDLALERAAAHASRFADGPANFVLYRAWSDARGEARVEVRRDLPLALGFGGARVETPASGVSLGLADGLTLAHSKGVVRASGSAAIPTLQPAAPLGNGAPAPRAPPSALVVGAGIAAAMGLALLLLDGVRSAIVALFTRLLRPRLLDAPPRRRIVELVRDEPGIHLAGICEKLGRRQSVAEHHLRVLVREGILTCVETPGFRRYFVTGAFSHAEMRALAALRGGQAEKVFRIIQANPGISVTVLAREAGVSAAQASRTVAQLHDAGLVDRVQVGRTLSLHALETRASDS